MLAIESPKIGTVIMWLIEDILNNHISGDIKMHIEGCFNKFSKEYTHGGFYSEHETDKRESWECLLEEKRMDNHYYDVVDSLAEQGFVRPLTCRISKDDGSLTFIDGHHRLAAALELGMEFVPVEVFKSNTYPISHDSGVWHSGANIPASNTDRRW